MSGPIMVEGPDGQRYEFPEGTSPEVMKSAMSKRYPKPAPQDPVYATPPSNGDPLGITRDEATGLARSQEAARTAPKPSFNDRVTYAFNDYIDDVDLSPRNLSDNLAATISGINNAAYRGLDDDIAGGIGKATGIKPLQQYEATQDRLRAEKPGAFMGGQMTGGLAEGGALTQMLQPKNIMQAIGIGSAFGASEAAAWGTGDADGPGQNRALEGAKMAPYGALFGGAMGGAIGTVSKILAGPDGKMIAAELQAVADREIRPQALKAIRRLLNASGVSDGDITALNNEVSKRIQAIDSSAPGAEGRKRLFQHYMEVLAGDEASPLYNPQAAANILMTVQERANTAVRGDTSRGIVGSAVKEDRASQVPFLEDSASNIAQGTRTGTKAQVKEAKAQLSAEYERILDSAPIQGQGADTLRYLLKADPKAATVLRRKAKNAGFVTRDNKGNLVADVNAYIDANPYRAGHWMRSRLSRDARSASGTERGDLLDSVEEIDDVLNKWSTYADTKRAWGTEQSILDAQTFGDRLFGGTQNNLLQNPGMRKELVDEFNALTDREKEIALISIRDQALGKIAGSAEDAPARLSQLNNRNALDFLEQVGQKAFADDIRAITRENNLLSVADAGNPLRQSASFSNAQARADAPPLYEGRLANAVNESTPGTLLGEAMLMTFAPHYQGAYAAYRGSRLAAKMGFGTRKKTLEDMTRFLMSRRDTANNLATPPAGSAPPVGPGNAFATPPNPMTEALSQPRPNPYMGRKSFRGAEEARGPRPEAPDAPTIAQPTSPQIEAAIRAKNALPSQEQMMAMSKDQLIEIAKRGDPNTFVSADMPQAEMVRLIYGEAADRIRTLRKMEQSANSNQFWVTGNLGPDDPVTSGGGFKLFGRGQAKPELRLAASNEPPFSTPAQPIMSMDVPGFGKTVSRVIADGDGGLSVAPNYSIEDTMNSASSRMGVPSPVTSGDAALNEKIGVAASARIREIVAQNPTAQTYALDLPEFTGTEAADAIVKNLVDVKRQLQLSGRDMRLVASRDGSALSLVPAEATRTRGRFATSAPVGERPYWVNVTAPADFHQVIARSAPSGTTNGARADIAGLLTGGAFLSAAGSIGGEESPVGRGMAALGKAGNAMTNALSNVSLPDRPIDRMRGPQRQANNSYIPQNALNTARQDGQNLAAQAMLARRQQLAAGPQEAQALRPFNPGERINNPDGSYSTEITVTIQAPDGGWVNVPSLWMGPDGPVKFDPQDERAIGTAALQYERQTGKKFRRFNSVEEAVNAAEQRSNAGGAGSGQDRFARAG